MQEYAKTLVSRDEVRDSEPPFCCSCDAEPARYRRKGQKYGNDESNRDVHDCETTKEEGPRHVAVADGPADEIWVSAIAEGHVQHVLDNAEGRGMCCVFESVQKGRTISVREIELARTARSDVM